MSLRLKHTSPKNKGGGGTGGPRPQAHTWVRQIVTCDNDSLDRHIDAWAVARGRRHKLVDNSNYFLFRHISNTLLWEIVGCQINNNGGDYGITIRLHSLGHRRLDQRPAQCCCKLCMADDVHRHERCNEGECGRNYFSFRISSENWFWSIYQKSSSFGTKGSSTGHDWLQNQRQTGAAFQVYPKMDENCRARTAGIFGCERRFEWTIEPLLLTKLFLVSKSSPRKNSSQDGDHQLLAFGICSWTTEQQKKSGNSVNLFSTELKLKPGNYLKNSTKNRINSFPPYPGREIAWGFFVTIIINNRTRPQAHN